MASRPAGAFGPALRVKKRRDFLRTQRGGGKHQLRFFMVFVRPRGRGADLTRLGITVTRKVCGAVGRNAIKRRVREAFRHRVGRFPEGLDVVFVAKRNAEGVSFAQVVDDMEQLLARLRRARGLDEGRGGTTCAPEPSPPGPSRSEATGATGQ